jgi:hypothetical protein
MRIVSAEWTSNCLRIVLDAQNDKEKSSFKAHGPGVSIRGASIRFKNDHRRAVLEFRNQTRDNNPFGKRNAMDIAKKVAGNFKNQVGL